MADLNAALGFPQIHMTVVYTSQ